MVYLTFMDRIGFVLESLLGLVFRLVLRFSVKFMVRISLELGFESVLPLGLG